MRGNLRPKKVRLNVQITNELKSKLSQLSDLQGKKVSTLVRESIEEKHPIPSASVSRREMVSKKIQLLIYSKLEPLTKRG